jgi:hypothetical protein
MTDFTKEEWICIRDNLVVPEIKAERIILYGAYHKILEMIDSYTDSIHSIETLKSLCIDVKDLQWRMNEVCNFLHIAERKDE